MKDKTVGEAIKAVREQRNMSQSELAQLAMLSRVSITKYENGSVEPGAIALSRIADALDVSTDFLLGRNSETEDLEQQEVYEIRSRIRKDPSLRMLFDASRKSTHSEIKAAVAMLKSFEEERNED